MKINKTNKIILSTVPVTLLISFSTWFFNTKTAFSEMKSPKNNEGEIKSIEIVEKPTISNLNQNTILQYSKKNSCYLTLLKDSSYFTQPRKTGFTIQDLINDSLPKDNPYSNRFLVADLMTLDENLKSRGVSEINPSLTNIYDLKTEDSLIIKAINYAENLKLDEKEFEQYVKSMDFKNAERAINFYKKVWKFITPPLNKKISFNKKNAYASGQKICLCEANKDTIELIAQFAVSGKRFSSSTSEYLPIGNKRRYYASQYKITSKCWDRERRYEPLDKEHDVLLGGGKKDVTFYKGAVELPNFLLMVPTNEFPKAVKNNGIHQVAIKEFSMALLGTANSLGCFRVSVFGSKFLRWWTPKNANFFVIYKEDRYHKKMESEQIKDYLPFKNEIEGNAFRSWLNINKPEKAVQLDIDSVGDYDNGHILYAYNVYGKEYNRHREIGANQKINLNENNEEEFSNEISELTKNKSDILQIKKPIKINEEMPLNITSKKLPTTFKKEASIILGSFTNKENAIRLSKSLRSEGFKNVKIAPSNNKHRVLIVEKNTMPEITKKLQSVRKNYSDAWVIYN